MAKSKLGLIPWLHRLRNVFGWKITYVFRGNGVDHRNCGALGFHRQNFDFLPAPFDGFGFRGKQFGTLDATLTVNFADNFSAVLEATNILDEASRARWMPIHVAAFDTDFA